MKLKIFLAWTVVFWAHSWQIDLKIDAMTYAALAKNILRTGDWGTLHYSNYAYSDFFQHPPLAIWMEALVFKLFGVSDWSARILPFLFSLGSVSLLFLICKKFFQSEWLGLLTAIVLITSTRYTKFASDFYLDGPLAFWMLAAISLTILAVFSPPPRRYFFAIASGLFLGLAFLTKGLVAFSIPLGISACAVFFLFTDRKKECLALVNTLAIALPFGVLVLLPWIFFGNGFHYLNEYWVQSVAERVHAKTIRDQWVPILHLLKVYWPWWPLLVWSWISILKNRTPEATRFTLLGSVGLVIVAAFSWVGHSIEHYFIPFYLLSAPLVARQLNQISWITRHRHQIASGFQYVILGSAVLLAIFPISLHGDRSPHLKEALKTALLRCPIDTIKTVYVTESVDYLWHTVALVQWKTPWQVQIEKTPESTIANASLLIVRDVEVKKVDAGWNPIPFSTDSPLRLYQASGVNCLELH